MPGEVEYERIGEIMTISRGGTELSKERLSQEDIPLCRILPSDALSMLE